MTDALFCAFVLFSFSGLSCYDDDDCHNHTVCCGGITVIRHCHSGGHSSHLHDGLDVSSQVVVLATDAPDENVRSLYVTVTEITLESGEAHPQTLYRSDTGHRVDLLSLRGSDETRLYELLAAPALVHAATYDSIWISVKDPTIVFASGEVVASADIVLDGAIAVVFREPVPIGSDEAVFVVLDFDVKRSLSRMKTDRTASEPSPDGSIDGSPNGSLNGSLDGSLGDGERWRFRPLIFATVVREEVSEELLTPTDLEGTIDELDADEETFDIDLPDGRGSVTTHAHDETVLLGPNLEQLRFEDLHLGKTVRVRGYWRPDGGLDAQSVLGGSTFRVAGRVERVERDGIVLSVATEDNVRATMRVAATRGTLLSFGRVETAVLQDIKEGLDITTTGYRDRGSDDSRTAALVDLGRVSPDPVPFAATDPAPRVNGRVTRIDRENRTVILRSGEGDSAVDKEVDLPRGSEILFLERMNGVLWQTPVHFEQIQSGMTVEVERLPGDGDSPALFLFNLRG